MNSPVVLVTGALTGIGRATALAFTKTGARVALSGRRVAEGQALERELQQLGADAVFFAADVRDDKKSASWSTGLSADSADLTWRSTVREQKASPAALSTRLRLPTQPRLTQTFSEPC